MKVDAEGCGAELLQGAITRGIFKRFQILTD
jgi:hypothetical protein